MMLAQKRATASRPWYSRGIGGMETQTSAVSKATSASTSPASYARTKFATSACSASTARWRAGGTCSAVTKAREMASVCLMPNAMPETGTIRENLERYAKATGLTPAEYQERIESVSRAYREHDAPQTPDHACGARQRGRVHGTPWVFYAYAKRGGNR